MNESHIRIHGGGRRLNSDTKSEISRIKNSSSKSKDFLNIYLGPKEKQMIKT